MPIVTFRTCCPHARSRTVDPASGGAEAKKAAPFPARSARRQRLVWAAAAASLALAGCATVMVANRPRALSDTELKGQQIFRYDTFGDEQKWTDQLRLHEIVDKMTPAQALALGLKVDRKNLNFGKFVLANPLASSGTRELLRQNAVVGVQATFRADGHIQRLGVTCALCHSTVDNAFLPGIGNRLDGWPNRSLNVGKIIALSPAVTPQQRAVYLSWGKGRYDPRFNEDGKNTPLVLPPAYGLAAVKNETYTGEAPISYWNAYVAVTQMGGHGNFSDPRLGINIHQSPDLVTPKLAPLRAYQHSLPSPGGSGGNAAAASRGQQVFAANCQSCHVGGNNTDNNSGVLHQARETGMDGAYAARTTKKAYRTTPLRGLRFHPPYFHDGSAASLADVVNHYDRVRGLRLTGKDKSDLVEYLKSL
jgi:mono/diheme cytochrome c family protein